MVQLRWSIGRTFGAVGVLVAPLRPFLAYSAGTKLTHNRIRQPTQHPIDSLGSISHAIAGGWQPVSLPAPTRFV